MENILQRFKDQDRRIRAGIFDQGNKIFLMMDFERGSLCSHLRCDSHEDWMGQTADEKKASYSSSEPGNIIRASICVSTQRNLSGVTKSITSSSTSFCSGQLWQYHKRFSLPLLNNRRNYFWPFRLHQKQNANTLQNRPSLRECWCKCSCQPERQPGKKKCYVSRKTIHCRFISTSHKSILVTKSRIAYQVP